MKYLFVGGERDGEWRGVGDNVYHLQVLKHTEKAIEPWKEGDSSQEYETETYTKRGLGLGSCCVFALEGMHLEEIGKKLIEGYQVAFDADSFRLDVRTWMSTTRTSYRDLERLTGIHASNIHAMLSGKRQIGGNARQAILAQMNGGSQ